MSFEFDGSDIAPSAGFGPVPKGFYKLKIINAVEKKSKSGHPQVVVDFEIQNEEYKGKQIRFHNVTFLPKGNKGAGIAIHFLKTIGEPFEGQFVVTAANWMDKCALGYVDQEIDWNNIPRNVVKDVMPISTDALGNAPTEGVPF